MNLVQVDEYLDWIKQKLKLEERSQAMQNRIVYRGHVYHCELGVNIGTGSSK